MEMKVANNANKWSPEEDARLRELWPLNTSYQLAAILGRSRMAIVGRANRLGIKKGHPEWEVARAAKARNLLNGRSRAENFGVRLPSKEQKDAWTPSPFTDSLPFLGITLFDLEPHHCRYMKDGKSLLFCGHDKRKGSSYCEAHHAQMYTQKELTK